jgi:hypothetical protein
MGVSGGPYIVRDSSLVLELDAADRNSYPGSGNTWRDLSANNFTGTLTNGPNFDSTNGGNIIFDGVDDNVTISQIGGTFSEMTFRAIIKPNGNQVSAAGVIFFRPSSNGINFRYLNTGLQLGFHWGDLPSTYNWGGGPTILNNAISDVCLTVNSTKATYYINGINSAELIQSYPSVTASDLKLGVDSGVAGRNFKGSIYSTSIYNRALSAQEVLQNYNAQKSRFNL